MRKSAQELPLVSIITPSLNQGVFIEETILSVKNQTYTHIEHIIIDGGSSDETLDILQKYGNDSTWISEPDEGQSDAINKGWRMAKGEILAYLNSDDTYMPWAVETAVQFLNDNPDVGMVYGGCNRIDENGEVTSTTKGKEFDLVSLLYGSNMVPQPSVFLRRNVLDEVGYLDTRLHLSMDLDLWIRIGLKFEVRHIPRLLANYRFHPIKKGTIEGYKREMEHLYIADKTFANPELPKEIRALKRRAYSYNHLRIGLDNYYRRDMKKARRHLMKSAILYPWQLRKPLLIGTLVTCLLGRKVTEIASGLKSRLESLGLN